MSDGPEDLDLGKTLEHAHRSECSSCEAPVVWAIMETSGKRNPLDPKPTGDGRLIVTGWQVEKRTIAPVVRALKRFEWQENVQSRYTSHFATCPYADDHRRRS